MATKYNWTYNVGDLIPYEIASNVTISTANTVWVQRAMEGLIDADGTPEKPYHSIALGQAANKTYIVANGECNEIINLTHHLIGDGFCLLIKVINRSISRSNFLLSFFWQNCIANSLILITRLINALEIIAL